MRLLTVLGIGLVAATTVTTHAAECSIPFPQALDAAAISVERLDRIQDDALLVGNGDINALVYSSQAEPRMMLTKNDVWDARLITADDPPLPKLRWIKQAAAELSPGGNTEIHEDGFRRSRRDGYHDYPYPFPKPCTQLAFGGDASSECWRLVRAGGSQNAFLPQNGGALMRIAGEAGCSNGYAFSLRGRDLSEAVRLCVDLSGTPNAKFFIDVLNETGARNRFGLHTGWLDSPADETTHEFELSEPDRHERLILYTWSTDGKSAENHIRRITLHSASEKVLAELPLDEKALTPRVFQGTLDIQRAVARVTEPTSKQCLLSARALADRNVLLIETSLPCRIVPTATFDSEPPQQGTTDEVARQVRTLLDGSFVDRCENLLVFGESGSGKTHLLCAVAQDLVRSGRKVCFRTCSLLVQELLLAKRDLKLSILELNIPSYRLEQAKAAQAEK